MNEVVHTSPTIGSNVEEIVINNTRFLMWDIGGQESLRSSWNTYYTNTEFVIVVVDSTDRERISVTREELYKMLAHEYLALFLSLRASPNNFVTKSDEYRLRHKNLSPGFLNINVVALFLIFVKPPHRY
ncbi:ARL5A, partial [Cervus elaphus hippelaphus]